MDTIAGRAAEARRRLGLSLRAAGRTSDLSRTYISDIEKGRANPSHRALQALDRAYGLKPGSIAGLTEWEIHHPPAYESGQAARAAGRGTSACPYHSGALRRLWLLGYHDGA